MNMLKKSFTLIELLVVVALIALLVSILLPALNGARERARQTVCSANLRTIAVGVQRYTQGNNDWLPAAEPPDREFPDSRHWFMNESLLAEMGVTLEKDSTGQMIGPAKTKTVLICPSHPKPWQWREGEVLTYSLSYGMNGTLGLGGRPDHLVHRRCGEFESESSVMMFSDACGELESPGIVLYKSCPMENFDYRHQDKVGVVFLDGHVRLMMEEAIPFGMARRYEPFWSSKRP